MRRFFPPGIRVVTGFVPIPDHPRSAAEYARLAENLRQIRAAPLTTFEATIDQCWLHAPARQARATHAEGDNPLKNTLAYHVVQHQKTEWLRIAAEMFPDDPVFVWIDNGMFSQPGHSVPLIDAFLDRARHERAISAPGCWDTRTAAAYGTEENYPSWRFCGSVLVAHRDHVKTFADAVRAVTLERLARARHVTWEVNDWSRVEAGGTCSIRWYRADHDQTQFTAY
jgi:hypothetical protein